LEIQCVLALDGVARTEQTPVTQRQLQRGRNHQLSSAECRIQFASQLLQEFDSMCRLWAMFAPTRISLLRQVMFQLAWPIPALKGPTVREPLG
jgi:hypothetical protein